MKKHKLDIFGLKSSQTQSGAYILTLSEMDGLRRLPIVIGRIEAEAIAVEIENIKPTRPLTHDLFRTFANAFEITIDEVIIYNYKEGIFFSMIYCTSKKDGSQHQIDSRTSDAIALAVRFNAPIYTYDKILSIAGINLDQSDQDEDEQYLTVDQNMPKLSDGNTEKPSESLYQGMDDEELENALNTALEDEDYETASKIRDELTKRKNQ